MIILYFTTAAMRWLQSHTMLFCVFVIFVRYFFLLSLFPSIDIVVEFN